MYIHTHKIVEVINFTVVTHRQMKSSVENSRIRYTVAGYFKGTNSVLKTMSHCDSASHLQWNIQFVTWLNPIKCNSQFVPRVAGPLRLPQECGGRDCKWKRNGPLGSGFWQCGIINHDFKTP